MLHTPGASSNMLLQEVGGPLQFGLGWRRMDLTKQAPGPVTPKAAPPPAALTRLSAWGIVPI